jgi:hypothetical protein
VAVGDVLKCTVDGPLELVAVETSGGMASVNGGLYSIGDGVNHGVHGRSDGSRHAYFAGNLARPARTSASLLLLLVFLLGEFSLGQSVSGGRACVHDNVLEDREQCVDEMD